VMLRNQNPHDRHKRRNKSCLTFGQLVADKFAAAIGSWTFIIIQSCLLMAWIVINICAIINSWDPYPFILLNLFLSCQAAYTGPMVMMSQNRQASIDRETLRKDYELSEESAILLAKIVTSLQSFESDRKKQVKLLTKILVEMEEEDDVNAPEASS